VNTANRPFQFVTASDLIRIENLRAVNAGELRDGLERCSDASIFFHTFQSLGRHHFLTESFSNDFAQWMLASLNQPVVAEQLAGLDVRNYVDPSDRRNDLLRIMDEFCRAHSDDAARPAFEPFHFCAGVEVAVPLGWEARTLDEFRQRLAQIGRASFSFHFVVSRLRLRLRTNDFSRWFAEELGLEKLARLANQIDILADSLDVARARLLVLIDRELTA
jgi:hypothetical protein